MHAERGLALMGLGLGQDMRCSLPELAVALFVHDVLL